MPNDEWDTRETSDLNKFNRKTKKIAKMTLPSMRIFFSHLMFYFLVKNVNRFCLTLIKNIKYGLSNKPSVAIVLPAHAWARQDLN